VVTVVVSATRGARQGGGRLSVFVACTAPKCRHGADLRVLAIRLRSAVVLVDHSAEDLPALHKPVQRHDGRLVMIGWPLLPGLVRPVPVIVPSISRQHRPQASKLARSARAQRSARDLSGRSGTADTGGTATRRRS
jgi:hypothetical protein